MPIRAHRASTILWILSLTAATAATPPRTILHITLPASAPGAQAGRLLVFAQPAEGNTPPALVDAPEFSEKQGVVAAQEIDGLTPGGAVDMDADTTAYPAGFSALKPGTYDVQAVLDTRHDYAYHGRAQGDLTSDVMRITIGAAPASWPALALSHGVPAADPWKASKLAPPGAQAQLDAARPHLREIAFVSPSLSQFWGRTIIMRGWVLLPPGYDPAGTQIYPTVYFTHGFGGSEASLPRMLAPMNARMEKKTMPPMIWVGLDESSATGTHEFADSVNNGPWGQALTTELIPDLERHYKMDARPGARFLNGHSSGGWATLWLQTRYPALFGGTWSTSPDPSDFHDFTGIDLYRAKNAYTRPDGTEYPLMRDKGKVLASFKHFAQIEAVLGPNGGQLSSFDWVFSPKSPTGAPEQMFDRATGAINPEVVAYWHDHYDIAHLVTANWPHLKANLTGKIHLIVGDADTFYLDGAAHRLQAALEPLHTGAQFTYLPGKTHFDLYKQGDDYYALLTTIAAQMYAVWKK